MTAPNVKKAALVGTEAAFEKTSQHADHTTFPAEAHREPSKSVSADAVGSGWDHRPAAWVFSHFNRLREVSPTVFRQLVYQIADCL